MTAGVAASSLDPSVDFRRYFGPAPPLLAALGINSVGAAALLKLQARYGLRIASTPHRWRSLGISVCAAVPFMVVVTLLDVWLTFPADINVRTPTALVFYPAMGYLAQLALHVIPFFLVLWLLRAWCGTWPLRTRLWLAVVAAALPEALLQMSTSMDADGSADLLGSLVGLQLLAFGIVELQLYRRFDYLCMVAFRLSYYAYWHVVWGTLRLEWLVT